MEVILKEKIRNLGDLGAKVKVKPGYARNYLIPKGMALQATKANIEQFEAQRAQLEKASAEKVANANAVAEKLSKVELKLKVKAGEGGKLFGSIGNRDLAAAISEQGIDVERHSIRLPSGVIREIGEYDFSIHLHTDVDVELKVIIESI